MEASVRWSWGARLVRRLSPEGVLTGAFLLVGISWVLVTDELLYGLVRNPLLRARLETGKGWLFVAVSALVLFVLARRLFAKLRASSLLLEATLESVADGILLVGPDGKVMDANP